MYMKRIALIGAAVALLAVSCGSGEIVATSSAPTTPPTTGPVVDSSDQLEALAAARQLWEAAPADYTITAGSDTLAVRSGEVVSLGSAEAPTVEDAYATIEDSIRAGAVVDVEYDAEFGYPTRVIIDLDGDGTADIELTYSDLEAMPIVATLEQLLEARALWESQGFDSYRYIFRVDCTCPDGGTFDVEVRDRRVFKSVPLDELAKSSQLTPASMELTFDDLEEWFTDSTDPIEEGLLAVDVRMDPELGYPRWFHIEADAIGDDQFSGRFTLVATIDLVLPYEPIEDEPDGPISGEDKRALEVARVLWEVAALEDYRYQLTFHCECPLATSGPFEVTVRGGETWSVVGPLAGSGPLPDKVMIEDFFDVIAITIDAGTDVDITYDDVLGYPVLAIIDTEAVAVDGGLAFSVSEFEAIDHLGFLSGSVLAGPQCPVQKDPPEPGCDDQPVSNVELVITSDNFGDVPVNTNRDGSFYVALEPGDYLITAPDLAEYLGTPEPVTVTIRPTVEAEINLFYDTGIR